MVGYFSKRIRAMQQQFNKTADRIVARDKKGMIPKHDAETAQCELCGRRHTKNEHRFHGTESHVRTHGDEAEGQARYVSEFSVNRKGSKQIAKMQKELATMGTPRTKKTSKKATKKGNPFAAEAAALARHAKGR